MIGYYLFLAPNTVSILINLDSYNNKYHRLTYEQEKLISFSLRSGTSIVEFWWGPSSGLSTFWQTEGYVILWDIFHKSTNPIKEAFQKPHPLILSHWGWDFNIWMGTGERSIQSIAIPNTLGTQIFFNEYYLLVTSTFISKYLQTIYSMTCLKNPFIIVTHQLLKK